MYKSIIRPLLFLLQPETVHHLVVIAIKFIHRIPGGKWLISCCFCFSNKKLEKRVFGIDFKNPVGLAAGFDKNAEFYNEFGSFGFSFVEIGTVTPLAQPGNPKPRSFRLLKDSALVNRMGFNNKGVKYAQENLKKKRYRNIIVGGNIGKNTNTPNSNATDDYLVCFNQLYDYVDYLVINISCPNIKDLRNLQEGEELTLIINTLLGERKSKVVYKPVLLKVSPDLSDEQLDETIAIAENAGIDGYIATNTTTSRDNLFSDPEFVKSIGSGGLSGLPLKKRSTEIIKYIYQKTLGKKPIIGIGGIMNEADAIEKLEAGASLIQLYTGFIYSGPFLVKRINKQIVKNL